MFFLHRQSIDIDSFHDEQGLFGSIRPPIQAVAIDEVWPSSVQAYNAMLLQPWLYRLFVDRDYLLNFQLDACILGPDHSTLLSRNHTYIGAPWTGNPGPETPDTGVGNGGFSLRFASEMTRR